MLLGNLPNPAAESDPNLTPGTNQHVIRHAPLNTAATMAACIAGLLIPGLGHILLRRWIRGLIFAACIIGMFVLGLGMEGKLYDLTVSEPLQYFALFADVGIGLPYYLAERAGLGEGEPTLQTFDYGTTFLWVCGLLNYLVVLDAYDIAQGRKP
jgi:uncharacterized protein DUF6677